MRKRLFTTALTIGFLMIPFSVHAEVYKWIDDKGIIHFTDDYSNVPSSYRERFKVEVRKDIREEETPSRPQETTGRGRKEQSKTVIYGEEDVWWKEKVNSSMEQLEEATTNYESAHWRFVEKAEELSRRRFGSPTMYKFDIIKLNRLNEERMNCKALMEEASERVRKLFEPGFWEAASFMGEENTTDIYGLGEDWWRDRVRPWKERLEKLNASYENAEKKFMGIAEDLSGRGFGNRHTIKAKIIELDRANQEVLNYRNEIAENEEALERISKDAEESKANPGWLK